LKAELNREDIVIAKFDATENDIPHKNIEVNGFPTFYLIKADDYEHPIAFNGGRTLDAWKVYLNKEVPEDTKDGL